MELFLYGFIIGIAISAPVGSVGICIVHKVMTKGKNPAFFIALGSLTVDTLFGIIALFSLQAINTIIVENNKILGLVSGIILIYVSIKIFFAKTQEDIKYDNIDTRIKDFGIGFILTITNPITAIAILGLLAWFGVGNNKISFFPSTILILGLITGLVFWWSTLIKLAFYFKNKIKINSLKIINQICGSVIFVLAILVLFRVL